jgi:glutamate/tyrosine decarboxylase-like PLP-dependent enzyme
VIVLSVLFCSDLGADEATFSLNFSRSASPILLQYYQFLRLGKDGYERIMKRCMKNADYLARCIDSLGVFDLLSANLKKGAETLPLVVFRIKPDKRIRELLGIDETDLVREMRTRGWIIPAYTLPKHCEDIRVCRILVRESVSHELIDLIVDDLKHKTVELMWRHAEQVGRIRKKMKEQEQKVEHVAGKQQTNSGGDEKKSESDGTASTQKDDPLSSDPDFHARRDLARSIIDSVQAAHPHRRLKGHELARGATRREDTHALANGPKGAPGRQAAQAPVSSHEQSRNKQLEDRQMSAVVC